jgi:hypothetical protein
MTIPLIPRIGALVLATTGFYAYVGSMVPQNEVQPPPTSIVIPADLTPEQMVTVGRESWTQGTLLYLPHDRPVRGASVSRSRGVDERAQTRVPA